MRKTTLAISMAVFLGYIGASSADDVPDSDVIESSLAVDYEGETVSYQMEDPYGGITQIEFDLKSETWSGSIPSGDIIAGTIPQGAVDEYRTENIPIPCFAGPWAAAGCIGAAVVGFAACEVRASVNVRRHTRACANAGYYVEIRSINGCGNVDSRCVLSNGFGSDEEGDQN